MINFLNKEHECFPTHYILNMTYPYIHKEGSMRGFFLLHVDITLSIYGCHNHIHSPCSLLATISLTSSFFRLSHVIFCIGLMLIKHAQILFWGFMILQEQGVVNKNTRLLSNHRNQWGANRPTFTLVKSR